MTGLGLEVIDIAKNAGDKILKFYKQNLSMPLVSKNDGSPVTQADLASHAFIKEKLLQKFGWPVVSEEDPTDYEVRKNWSRFWLVDPLDGTKDFLAANDEFSVNIALIEDRKPIVGVIFAPATGETFYAEEGIGSFLLQDDVATKLPMMECKEIRAANSRFHNSDTHQTFLNLNGIDSTIACGSALKFGKLAIGHVNIYPRFVGSSEWDIAAGHIIIKEAGCLIIDLTTNLEPVYNKPSFRNHHFLAFSNRLKFTDFKLPMENK